MLICVNFRRLFQVVLSARRVNDEKKVLTLNKEPRDIYFLVTPGITLLVQSQFLLTFWEIFPTWYAKYNFMQNKIQPTGSQIEPNFGKLNIIFCIWCGNESPKWNTSLLYFSFREEGERWRGLELWNLFAWMRI